MSNAVRHSTILTIGIFFLISPSAFANDGKISFARHIRPILSNKCFFCHGPDAKHRKADLRLDTKAGARAVLVPGHSKKSELVARITADKRMMPPQKSGKKLTPTEIKLLKRWIDEGAQFEPHWSFLTPKKAKLPTVKGKNWTKNAIDFFVLAKLERLGVRPSRPADRRTLIRRVSFDLTGLPPTLEEVRAFVNDKSPRAYEKVVDRLLASPHYGERMAMVWLDAARYSDTDGFQLDQTRTNWPWRDWVVQAYNRNMPFDQFTIEQFAGDLLPKASKEQILATSFHRHHMTNGEGGRDPEESRIDYVVDRINTMGTVWLGLTLGCCQCHNHRYDPIAQKEYYQLIAFFNSIDEDGRAGRGAKPFLQYKSSAAQTALADAKKWLQRKERERTAAENDAETSFDSWLKKHVGTIERRKSHSSWTPFLAHSASTTEATTITVHDDGRNLVSGPNPRHDDYVLRGPVKLRRATGMRLQIFPLKAGDGKHRLSLAKDGHVILTNLKVNVRRAGKRQLQEIKVASARADYENKGRGSRSYGPVRGVLDDDPRTGWLTAGRAPSESRTAVFEFTAPVDLAPNDELVIELRHRSLRGNSNIRLFRIDLTDERGAVLRRIGRSPLEKLASVDGDVKKLTKNDVNELREQFLQDHQPVVIARRNYSLAKQRYDSIRSAANGVQVMVLKERKNTRATHLLKRGVWNKPGERVHHAVPSALSQWPASTPKNRLGLAKWLVSKDNPLTARVAVNRYWQMYFGAGLVRTPEDFGSQGEMPTHPDLLDWLAVEFMEIGWNVKHVQKLIVMSATYRQSSHVSAAMLKRDPENRLLARAGRFRLPSWMIRDAALRRSGLLQSRLGGPPVFPYQPLGVWAQSTMGRFHYQHSVGSDVYRRSLYTFWRRSVAPTGMFDAPQRRVCQIRITRTNTPLHALNLMNDTTYVEAARVLAQDVMIKTKSQEARLLNLFERVLARRPAKVETDILARQLLRARKYYQLHENDRKRILSHGQASLPSGLDRVEIAAYSTVATTLLNLDEAVTHE